MLPARAEAEDRSAASWGRRCSRSGTEAEPLAGHSTQFGPAAPKVVDHPKLEPGHLGHILPASERPGGNQRFGPLGADHRQILELLLARAVQIDPAHLVMNFAMASRLALPGVAVSVGLVLVWHAMFLLARPQTRCTV